MPTIIRKAERWSMRTIIVVLIGFLAMRGCGNAVETLVKTETRIVQRTDSLQHYRDAYGTEHGKRLLAEGNLNSIERMYGDYIDTLTARLDIKDKQLQSFTAIGTQTTGTVPLTVRVIPRADTLPAYAFSFSDRWLDLRGDVGSTNTATYTMRDSLTRSTYWKRRWFLGRKSYYEDVYSHNPAVTVTGLQGVQIAREPGRLGIGPHIGYGFSYDGQTLRHGVQAGVSLSFQLLRF